MSQTLVGSQRSAIGNAHACTNNLATSPKTGSRNTTLIKVLSGNTGTVKCLFISTLTKNRGSGK